VDTNRSIPQELGGRAHYLVLAVFDISSHPPQPVLLARGQTRGRGNARWRPERHDLRAALRDGSLSVDDPRDLYF